MEKTLAMRILDGKKIAYDVLTYADKHIDAVEVANTLDIPEVEVFKTLVVVRSGHKPILAMVPAGERLNLKALARAAGNKKVSMVGHDQAETLTGLRVGGISALALLNKGFEIWADDSILEQSLVCVSAGKRGIQLRLDPNRLVKITGAKLARIAKSTD